MLLVVRAADDVVFGIVECDNIILDPEISCRIVRRDQDFIGGPMACVLICILSLWTEICTAFVSARGDAASSRRHRAEGRMGAWLGIYLCAGR